MTQALPRLLLALKGGREFTLLLPKDHCSTFHTESLKNFGLNTWETLEVGQIYYETHDILYPSHDVQIGDYHDELVRELSRSFRKGLTQEKNNTNYIFIQRTSKKARRILNEEEVFAVLVSNGFTIVSFENLTFDEQRTIAGNATFLVGIHGAGLTNMLFMEEGSSILELTSILDGEQYYYYTLSNALKHKYYYQLCEPDAQNKSIQEANLIVDVELLRKNIELMIEKSND